MARLAEEYAELVHQWPHLRQYPFKESRIRCRREGLATFHSDNRHIEYDFARASLNSHVQYLQLLEKELRMRNVQVAAGQQITELQVQLHEILLVELRYKLLKEVLEEASLNNAMIKLEKAIPDLLHLENRGSEAIITHLFLWGLHRVEGSAELTQQLIRSIQLIINEQLFGEQGCPSNWQFPLNDDGTMGDVSFANWRARRIIENINYLVDLCFPGEENAQVVLQWNNAVEAWQKCLKVCL
jgi:hypothetical protein